MSFPISERSERALRGLFAHAANRPDAPTWLVDQLVDAEQHRRGFPDASGAFHALALNQGSLLKEEYDLSTHGHADGWLIGAVLVDPLEFMLFNQRYSFAAGDAALRALVGAMYAAAPKCKVVRTHTDGFAMLFGPTADSSVRSVSLPELSNRLSEAVHAVRPVDDEPPRDVRFTLGALELTVVDPPNWQLLGPLVWAECERSHIIARRSEGLGVMERRIVLSGRLPSFD